MDIDEIKKLLASDKRFTQRGLAEAMGIDPAGVTRMLRGERKISTDEVPKIENYFGLRSEEVDKVVVTNLPPLLVWLSVADGRQGAFMLSNKAIDEVDRPRRFRLAEKAFVIRVVADDNDPVFEIDDELVINPESALKKGCACLFTNEANHSRGAESIVARYIDKTDSHWVIENYPARGERKISRSTFPQAWRIVGRFM